MPITPQIGTKESFHMEGSKYTKTGESLGPLSPTSSSAIAGVSLASEISPFWINSCCKLVKKENYNMRDLIIYMSRQQNSLFLFSYTCFGWLFSKTRKHVKM